jgi:hypothetical protein
MMPDGRVVGIRTPGDIGNDANQGQIVVVLNWHDELKQRVPIH